MDGSCKNCEGVEYYCEDSNHSPVYFCDCKQAKNEHKGHLIRLINFDYPIQCISEAIQECMDKKKEFRMKAEQYMQKMIETVQKHDQELENVIQKFKEIKQGLLISDRKAQTYQDYIKSFEPEEVKQNIQKIRASEPSYFYELEEGKEVLLLEDEVIQKFKVSEAVIGLFKYPDSDYCSRIEKRLDLEFLKQILPYSKVSNLDLGSNQTGVEGAKGLASVIPQPQLTIPSFRDNPIIGNGWGEPIDFPLNDSLNFWHKTIRYH